MTQPKVTKAERVSALTTARASLLARFYKATKELEEVKDNLTVIDSQLIIMQGLEDPAPVEADGS